jgi:hypothetical protein
MTGTREFRDTIPVQRREPMPFEPLWYRRRAAVAMCRADACEQGHKPCPTPDACRRAAEDGDSEFGAFDGLVHGARFIVGAWVVIGLIAAAVWWLA